MPNAASTARERTLADLPVGVRGRIVDVAVVGGADRDRLATLGIRRGAWLTVEGDAPFHGPRIVRLGAARIAIAGTVARSIRVRTLDAGAAPR
jgi:Fe2+ transport system protein FeoA